jgi:Macrocin-O-methyltransferase (TylF)
LAELARRLSYRLGLASRPSYQTSKPPEEISVSPEPEVMQAVPERVRPKSEPSSAIYTPVYDYDGLRTDPAVIHNHDFMLDARYVKAMRAGARALGHDYKMYWRLHVALSAASRASRLPGDFVECGVCRGFLSTAIMTYLDWGNLTQRFYLFDTFEGLIPELLNEKERQNIDKIQHLNSYFKDTFAFVSQHFRKFPRVKLVKGQVPDTLNDVEIEKVSFISIDMNCVGPEIAAANFFWPKMVPGAFMLLDDYGFVSYEEQKSGFDAFAAERGTSVLALPSGQGLIVKDAASAA